MEVVDDKKRRYHPGWSAKKVAKTEKKMKPLDFGIVKDWEVVE
jgi:hypothetical protein